MPHHFMALLLLASAAATAVAAPANQPRVPSLSTNKGQSYHARLSTVPIDVAMQSTVAGTGSVTAMLVGSRLTITGTFADLKSPATTARLHVGPRGIRGPAILDLTVSGATRGTLAGTFDLSPAQLGDLANNRLYIQLHSDKAPEGNLWGWLLPREKGR